MVVAQRGTHQYIVYTHVCKSIVCLHDYHTAILQQYDYIYSNHLCTSLGVKIVFVLPCFAALQGWIQTRAANKVALETTNQTQLADFASWRQQQLMQLRPEEG